MITAARLVSVLLAGSEILERHQQEINDLNVFPVPDGDTGTNMLLTARGMVEALGSLDLGSDSATVGQVALTSAEASLLAARGNSGVIFSQLIRGLARGLRDKTEATPLDMARAFQYGLVYAYQAVTNPVEGTMLTVAREAAKSARGFLHEYQGLDDLLTTVITGGNEALARTPEQLPVLKRAGVVDAGGYGLLLFLQGCLQGLTGETVPLLRPEARPVAPGAPGQEGDYFLTYRYCTELIVRGCGFDSQEVRGRLAELGDSLVLVPGMDIIKVHIHTNHPGLVLEAFTSLGTLHQVKIDNMAEQHRKSPWLTGPGLTVVAVVPGGGFAHIFQSLGADCVIPGGANMTPSVQDFLQVMPDGGGIVVLPNSSTACLTAEQAAGLTGAQVCVIPTADPQQGLAALLALDRHAGLETNRERMLAAMHSVRTARITYAVRDTNWENKVITVGMILGFIADRLAGQGNELVSVVSEVVSALLKEAESAELLTLFRGSIISASEAGTIQESLTSTFPQLEIELKDGGQENDYFLLMLE